MQELVMTDPRFTEFFANFKPLVPRCVGCGKRPAELAEYVEAARPRNYGLRISPDTYVRLEEGTYNPQTGRFACSSCYVAMGMPASPTGWRAP
jgi:hypothetical protein